MTTLISTHDFQNSPDILVDIVAETIREYFPHLTVTISRISTPKSQTSHRIEVYGPGRNARLEQNLILFVTGARSAVQRLVRASTSN